MFASKNKAVIKTAKIMIIDQEYFNLTQLLKFNGVHIKFDLERIILTKKTYINSII